MLSVKKTAIGIFHTSAIANDMWAEVRADSSYVNTPILKRKSASVANQFYCHAINPGTVWKASWNLEPTRPNVGLQKTYVALCYPN
ncbi:DUF2599 domain-containing protein [Listeria sp. FSL L7-1509]|uniref:DUF2599 domain-containing protein n=1 Tax=Listeria immobilis TaxID=2713502 RepID=A0ABR6SZV9_9LIST|nr:DUF2599 domain-containing protein [Listeria immobilis]MBC1484463.1 DUF2599 domain-containing protein [Listeria immobilis]MBC1506131.1 DUF2599 domain-containing protein [Listeria immobilis]MBC1511147.1 DUF2599 domain-containing protein [Listeria immobilis]MBC6303136.1 DUF2599 domain-containing protein [Listeria immobilis]MBC6313786.1 DUF2599 domain-containing protein [Listeria immobilis]